jgi:solute carrier family 39 (zinc transporter), member 9
MSSLSEFEVEIGDLENEGNSSPLRQSSAGHREVRCDNSQMHHAYPLTIGLVIHGLADGFALGVSTLSPVNSSELSLVVFFALAIHKGELTTGHCVARSITYF